MYTLYSIPYCKNQNEKFYLGKNCQYPEPIINCARSSISVELEFPKEKIGYIAPAIPSETSRLVLPQHDPGILCKTYITKICTTE